MLVQTLWAVYYANADTVGCLLYWCSHCRLCIMLMQTLLAVYCTGAVTVVCVLCLCSHCCLCIILMPVYCTGTVTVFCVLCWCRHYCMCIMLVQILVSTYYASADIGVCVLYWYPTHGGHTEDMITSHPSSVNCQHYHFLVFDSPLRHPKAENVTLPDLHTCIMLWSSTFLAELYFSIAIVFKHV